MKRMKQHKIGYIPQEIVVKILLLLPFESILSCKRVSKQWRDLINDPGFHKHYLTRSSLSFLPCYDSLYCLLIRSDARKMSGTIKGRAHPPFTLHRLPIESICATPEACVWENVAFYLGMSSGMLCLLLEDGTFSFYNLFTGDSFKVIDAPQRTAITSWLCFGFGYNRYADDYKLMVVCNCKYDTVKNVGTATLYWVYSFTDSVWRPLKGFPYGAYYWAPERPQAFSFNGILHWVAWVPKDGNSRLVIVTYDLHTCEFGEILVWGDHNFSRYDTSTPILVELDGKLCCWISGWEDQGMYELMVMKEYGVAESWTPLIRVSGEITPFSKVSSTFLHAPAMLYECRDGKKGVLFVTHVKGSLHWYNTGSGKVRAIHQPSWRKRMMKHP